MGNWGNQRFIYNPGRKQLCVQSALPETKILLLFLFWRFLSQFGNLQIPRQINLIVVSKQQF